MLEEIFNRLPEAFVPGAVDAPVSFYFTLGETKRTVHVSPDACKVETGKTVDNADCVCKTSPEFFLRIWQDDYRPGMKDFLSGTIKSNNPGALQTFLRCFGKKA
jgi:putative sterol carrier protein